MVREWEGTFVRKDILFEVQSVELEVVPAPKTSHYVIWKAYLKTGKIGYLRHAKSSIPLPVLISSDRSNTCYIVCIKFYVGTD